MTQFDRRAFLARGLGTAAALGATAAPGAALRLLLDDEGVARTDRTLVVLQLSGGNDGLNTVLPLDQWKEYRSARPRLALPVSEALRIERGRGLHPSLAGLRAQYERGRLAIVEGVGYPQPNRSHFHSMDVWHTADPSGTRSRPGWIGRLSDLLTPERPRPGQVLHVGREVPYALHSERTAPVAFSNPAAYRWVGNEAELDAYGDAVPEPEERRDTLDFVRGVLNEAKQSSLDVRRAVARRRPRAEYPRSRLADALRVVAAVLDGGIGVRVASVEMGGFDTHAGQANTHHRLLRQVDEALTAFLEDLAGTEAERRTVVLAWSEFGRRVAENASGGTDHGAAAPAFLLGAPVRGGLHGEPPRLDGLDERGDLVHTTDFRSLYATLAERWFGIESEALLGARFPLLDLV